MKTRILPVIIVVGIFTGACTATDEHGAAQKPAARSQASQPAAVRTTPEDVPVRGGARRDEHGHTHDATGEVPAFVTSASELRLLPATLAPEKFAGKQRLGYEVVREIPRTIAQLPCYCHCDKGFGHKSLHSCFVDDHAAHCAVCIDEALMAYKMEKEGKLTPEQIRERIIAHYSAKQ